MAPDDTLWLTDDGDHTVRHCTPDGKVLLTIRIPGKPKPYMSGEPFHRCTRPCRPRAISTSPMATATHGPQVSPDGTLIRSWGEPGTDPGQFNIAHNICCDADGWVTSPTARTIACRCSTATATSRRSGSTCPASGLFMERGPQGRFFVGEMAAAWV